MAANADTDGNSPIDFDWLNECTDNDAEAAKTMLTLYFEHTAILMGELETALKSASAPEVRRLAHACAGSSGTCGMRKLMSLFKELESQASTGTVNSAGPLLDSIRQEFARAKACADKAPAA